MTTDANQIRRELETVERYLATLTEQARRVEGERDRLLRQLLDHDGAASSRFVGAR
jgi:hypothetical protein